MAGTVIAAALVTGIKSDLSGDVIATVTEPVYDTATGKYMLIPQGSRLLGIGAELAAPENRNGGDRVIIAGRDSLKDSVNQVGRR